MITTGELVWGFSIPLLLALALLLAGAFSRKPAWGGTLALAIAFVIAFRGMTPIDTLPPARGQDWLMWMIVPAAIVGLWDASQRIRFRLIIGFVLFFFVMLAMLSPLNRSMQSGIMWAWTITLGIGITAWWWLNDALATVRTGALMPALFGFIAAAAALALINTGQQDFGKLSAAVALFFWIMAIIDGIWRQSSLARGGMVVANTIIAGLLVIGFFYGDFTLYDAAFLAIAPLLAWLGEMPGIRPRTPLRLLLAVIPALVLIAFVAIPNGSEIRQTLNQGIPGGE